MMGAAFFYSPLKALADADRLASIERRFGGRLGVFAFHIDSRKTIAYRANERFPMASTVKVPVVMAALERVDRGESLQQPVHFTAAQLAPHYSRISREYPRGGTLDLETVCAYTISESDQTGVDLLFRLLGGPRAVESYIQRIGFPEIRIDRPERELPDKASLSDSRDTTTPRTMAKLMARLVTGSPLSARTTSLLLKWMRGTVTGDTRLRAGVPKGWHVADKTGTYANAANDIGLLQPPSGAPIAIAVYAFGKDPDAGSTAIAQVASEVTRILHS
jgi:beta-lactamase class A